MWSWVTGSSGAAPEEAAYSDDEEEGERIHGVRLMGDKGFVIALSAYVVDTHI
jgi:hypothetical protein